MTIKQWNGKADGPYDLPEGLAENTRVRVWSKEDQSDAEEGLAGDFDWRWIEHTPEEEVAFLRIFNLDGNDTDIKYYEALD